MVLYFSGTGNSKYIAQKIANALDDELLDLNDRIKRADFSKITAQNRFVFVTPTYAWRMPRIVSDFVENIRFEGAKRAWFVLDCGGEIGNPGKYLEKLCDKQFYEISHAEFEGYDTLFQQKLKWYRRIEQRLKKIEVKRSGV